MNKNIDRLLAYKNLRMNDKISQINIREKNLLCEKKNLTAIPKLMKTAGERTVIKLRRLQVLHFAVVKVAVAKLNNWILYDFQDLADVVTADKYLISLL